ncbi:MAG: lysK [Candidatus Midichloriaceae bacterium]|jgi:lysyl-tRNA synthetase class 1|nr:lysK [Candidatus Midichloriaceae bacterium]
MSFDIEKALASHAWPFKEAKAILKHIDGKLPKKGYVLFETGYGPSGLPHIGTFGEVVRTTMVRKAFEQISGMPTRLFCVSDDMDGMRKVPDIIPNSQEYLKYIGLPLTKVTDPFGTHESYGHNMNARLRAFLDGFGFEYEFLSATDCYKNGTFDEMLLKSLEHYEDIMAIMLPTLGPDRQKTYSPFLPVCPETGHVLQVPVLEYDKKKGTITYKNEKGNLITSPVTGGNCKLQWKPDFGMRWAAFDVDFEMYGKDHLVNGPIYTRICRAVGGKAPHQMYYELFLDEKGEKISKSKGNGITIDEWLNYATKDSLSYFMYLSPQKAKKLYFDVIPKCMDEYLNLVRAYHNQEPHEQLDNPVYHIHNGNVPRIDFVFSYALLINLVSASGSEERSVVTGYIKHAEAGIDVDHSPLVSELVDKAIYYYQNFVKPYKKFRAPNDLEKAALLRLAEELKTSQDSDAAEELQSKVYMVGRESGLEMKNWFVAVYEVLLGCSQGPRFGSFIKLYGVSKTIELIREKCV